LYGGFDGKDSFGDVEVFDIETHLWHVLNIQSAFYLNEKEEESTDEHFLCNTMPTSKNKRNFIISNNNTSNAGFNSVNKSNYEFDKSNIIKNDSEIRESDFDKEVDSNTNNFLSQQNIIENGVVDKEIRIFNLYNPPKIQNKDIAGNIRDSNPINNLNKFHNYKAFNVKSNNNEQNNYNNSFLNSSIYHNNAYQKNQSNNYTKTETINNSNNKINFLYNKNNINNEKIISCSPIKLNDKFLNSNYNKNHNFTNNMKTPIKIANCNLINQINNQLSIDNHIESNKNPKLINKNDNDYVIERNFNNSSRKPNKENLLKNNNQKIIDPKGFPFSDDFKINNQQSTIQKINVWSNEKNSICSNGFIKHDSKSLLNYFSSKNILKDIPKTNLELDFNLDSNMNEDNIDFTHNSDLISKANSDYFSESQKDCLDKARLINTSCSVYDSNSNVKLLSEKEENINILDDYLDSGLYTKLFSNSNLTICKPMTNEKFITTNEPEKIEKAYENNIKTENDTLYKTILYPNKNRSFSLIKYENLNFKLIENRQNRKLDNSKIFTFLKWKKIKAANLPNPRNAHSSTVINKYIFIFGGHYKNFHLNDFIILDTINNCWLIPNLSGFIPSGLRGHTSSAIFNNFYIFGGYDGKNRVNDLYRFSLEDFNFIKIPNNREIIFPRQRHTANVFNEKIFFFGGFEGNKWINNMDILNVDQLENNLLKEKFKKTIKSDLCLILNNKEYSDLTFIVENKEIYAHKALLCLRVEYFKNMFSEHMLEKNSQVVEIFEYAYDVFLEFLSFVYSSEINKKSFEVIKELFKLSDNYAYDPLKKYTESALSLMLELHNVIEILIIGYKFNSNLIEKVSIDFIFENRKNSILLNEIHDLIEYPNLMTKILRAFANA